MTFLTEPTPRYKESFLEGLREFQKEGKQLHYDIHRLTNDFDDFVRRTEAQRDRRKLPPHVVPGTDYWLIDAEEYIGRLSLRYELNDMLNRVGGHIGYEIRPSKRRQGYGRKILKLGLEKAREIGLKRALVTCDETNIASKKVIEYNGGKLENIIEIEGAPVKKMRYWIELEQDSKK